MKQVNPYKEMVTLGKSGSIADFVAAAVDNRTNPKALEKLKEGMRDAEENFLKRQKSEAISMLNAGDTPVATELTIPLRIAFEIAKAKKKFIPPNAQKLSGVKIEVMPEALSKLEQFANLSLPAGIYSEVRDVVGAFFKDPFAKWLQANRKGIAAFRDEYGDTTIIVEKLPQFNEPIGARLTSPRFEKREEIRLAKLGVTEFLKEGIHTRQPVHAPDKASFKKRSHGRVT